MSADGELCPLFKKRIFHSVVKVMVALLCVYAYTELCAFSVQPFCHIVGRDVLCLLSVRAVPR